MGRFAPVVHRTWEIDTSFVRGVIAASKAARVASSSLPSPTSTNASSIPNRSRAATSGPRPPGCSWRVVTARSPGFQSTAHVAMFMPSVVEWVMPTESTSVARTAAIPARASARRSRKSSKNSALARPVRTSQPSRSAIAAAVSAGSGPAEPVFR